MSTDVAEDTTSKYYDDTNSALRSSIHDSIEENGRLYHRFRDGKYVLPNDDREQERLDLQNHIFSLTLDGKLHLAPLDAGHLHNVLDVGTGTGIWAIDFGTMYPSARVIGTDLSPIQPSYVPPNVSFEIGDAEEEWQFQHKFDYIHGRMLTVCFKDVKQVFQRAFDAMQLGGWLEMQDACSPPRSDDGSSVGTAWEAWWACLLQAGKQLGRPFGTEPPNYARYLEEIGFVDVHVDVRRWPFGPWMKDKKMKEIGLWSRANMLEGLEATAMAVLTRGQGKTQQDVEAELVEVRKDLMNPAIHTYMPVYIVWARKPK